MDITFYLIFCSMAFVAAIVQGVSGFAYGVVVLMVYPHLFGYTHALALTNLMCLIVLAYNCVIYYKYCNWHWVPVSALAMSVGIFVGVTVLDSVGDNPIWYILMGILFILMAIYLLWGQKRVQFQHNYKSLTAISLVGGLIQGAFAVGGPVMATFWMDASKTKEEYLGTQQVVGIFTMSVDVGLRAGNGMFAEGSVKYALIGLVFIFLGLSVGRRLVAHMNGLTLRRVVCGVMIFDGVVTLVSHL